MFHGNGLTYNNQPEEDQNFTYEDFNTCDKSWVKYDGEFNEDQKHGVGTLYFLNGTKFFGTFVHDKVEGKGSYYRNEQDLDPINGIWSENIL